MNWRFKDFPELQADASTNGGFYLYLIRDDHVTLLPDSSSSISNSFNLIEYLNPVSSPEKYHNEFTIVAAYTYHSFFYVCLAYSVVTSTVNYNGDTVDIAASRSYFSYHQKECYKLSYSSTNTQSGTFIELYQLNQPTAIDYSSSQNP